MRFFSRKTRADNKIIIFRALESKLWRFVDFSTQKIKYVTNFVEIFNFSHVTNIQRSKRKVLFACVAFCVLLSFTLLSSFDASVAQAKKESSFKPQNESIDVYPSDISSQGWLNVQTVNNQDLSEQSLTHEFNTSNSAHIDREYALQHADSNSGTADEDTSVESESVDSTEEGNAEQNENLPDAEGDTQAPQDDVSPEIPEEDPVTETVVPAVEESDSQSSNDSPEIAPEEVSYFSVFKKVVGKFLFTQAETTELILETNEESSEPLNEEELTSEEIPIAEEETSSSIPEETISDEVVTETEEILPAAEEATSSIEDEEPAPTGGQTVAQPIQETNAAPQITLSNFGIPGLASGQFINNLQLRLSLAGQYDMSNGQKPGFVSVEYSFGEFSRDAGSILLDAEISNAINGGYYLIPLPSITDPELLKQLVITISFDGDVKQLQSLYIDAAWLEVGTVVFDKELLKERFSSDEMLKHLDGPVSMELLSEKLDFLREELPQFNLRYNSQRNFLVQAFRSFFGRDLATVESVEFVHNEGEEVEISPEVTVTQEGLISVVLTEADKEQLFPGIYTVELEINEGGLVSTDTFEFQWGLLSINSNQTTYESGDVADISMGALTSNGNTLCDANLNLYISDPNGFISSTQVLPSGYCNGNNVIDVPDYSSQFVTGVPGEYEMYLERVDESGSVISHTLETFFVASNQPIVIERSGPTRIYPPSPYAMELTVHALRRSFTGEIVERVPKSFAIFNTDAEIRPQESYTELVWKVDMASSSSLTVSYEFDAPDISPYLYELGPAQLISNEIEPVAAVTGEEVQSPEVIEEGTEGQGPVDVSGSMEPDTQSPIEPEASSTPVVDESPVEPVTPETSEPVPTDDSSTVESETGEITPEQTPVEPEPVPSTESEAEAPEEEVAPEPTESSLQTEGDESSYVSVFKKVIGKFLFTQAETTEFTTEVEDESVPLLEEEIIPEDTGVEMEEDVETATSTVVLDEVATGDAPLVVATSTNIVFVEHRQWQIASDATGNMLLYWDGTNIPSGWTCVSCLPGDVFYQRFIQGSSTAGTNGGVSTHTHTATGGVTASASSTSINSGGGGATNVPTVAHAHTYTPTISTDNNLPAYRELVVIQYNSAGSPPTIPAGAIAIFDAAVPTGWTQYSAQDGRYIRGAATTTVGTASSSNTHTHSITGSLVATGNFTTAAAGDNLVNTASANHTHIVSSVTGTVNHEPPYREAVLGKLNATSSPTDAMIAMWTDEAPLGWGDLSGPSDPFENRFVKASTTYGGTGGAATTTHSNITVTSQGPSGTQTRDLVTIDNTVTTNAHTHQVDVTNFSAVATIPPFRTAVFAKRDVGGAVPEAPTTIALFDNEQTGTSTPSFTFTANDPDGSDTLVYQFQWDDDVDVGTSPVGDRTSDNESGCTPNCFSNTASSTDTHPYTENEQMRFTIQTALTNGVTYYWRVRAKETVGNIWGEWSSVRSFTYTTGIDPSTWFQTEGSQFERGTLTNTASTSGTAQLATTSTAVPTVVSGWRVATTSPGASLVLTKPSNVEIGDLLMIIVGNDDNTANAQWNNTTLKPTGFTLINESGNTTSDTHTAAFYRVADGTEGATTSVPAQISADYWGYYIRVTGASTTNPINVVGADNDDAGAVSHAVTSVNTTVNNTLAFYVISGDGDDTYPFSVSGTGWSESAEVQVGAGGNGSAGTWGTRSMVTAGATGAATVAFSVNDSSSGFQFAINPSHVKGTVMSPEVDFDSVSGQSDWGVVTWNTTEPTHTDTRLQLFYTSTLACDTILPDSALPGNSTGFDVTASELFINTLSTTTYNRICLRMTFDLGFGTTSPSLNDWTVDWAVPNQIPYTPNLALYPAFNNLRATTTRPTLGGFAATDFEGDAMEFELIVSTSSNLTSPILTKQSSNYPTDAGWSASTFASGATTTYALQAGDELTVGTTYWWAVRARDPSGTNTWSATSTARSMSVNTFIGVPEWYQTTDAQFDEATLSNATTSGDSVEIETIGTPSTVITTQADWLQQYASTAYPAGTVNASYAIAAGTDRMLVVAIGSTRTTVGTQSVSVTYGGQAMTLAVGDATNATNRNHTYIFYLNDAGIAAASGDDLDVTITGGTSYYNYVYAAVFAGVDQTTVVTDARNYFSGATANATVGPFSAGLTINQGDQAIEVINLARSTAGAGVRTVTTWSNATWPSPSSVAATYVPGTNWGLGFHINNRNVTTAGTEASGHTASAAGTHDSMSGISLKVAGTGSQGTIMSTEVDHDSVPNQSTWGEVSWSVTEPAGSETRMRLYYSSTTVCDTIITDGALPGNSTGFTSDTSPLDISTLSTTTYNRICLQMELQQDSASTSPILEDWTVSWVLSPQFVQQDYQWYVNAASTTPTDIWPVGGVDLNENEAIDSSSAVLNADVLRLRMSLVGSSTNASADSELFNLQYAEGDTCSVDLTWYDVGDAASTTALWRGYENGIAMDDWYDENWSSRTRITIQASQIDAGLTNFPVYVNLDDLSSAFFSTVKTDGSDIRVTESDGVTEVPIELVSIDTSGTDGELYFRATSVSSTTDTTFYIYYGNSGASAYASTSPYGARSVWSNGYILVSHMNDLTTSVVENSAGTLNGVKTSAGNPAEVSTGPVSEAQDFSLDLIQYTGTMLTNATQYAVSLWFNPDALTGGGDLGTYGLSLYGISPTAAPYQWLTAGGTGNLTELRLCAYEDTATTCVPTSGAGLATGNWYHTSVNAIDGGTTTVRVNGVQRLSYINGSENNVGANFTIGDLRGTPQRNIGFDGRIDEVRVSTTTRADAWRDAEYRNMATSTDFYTVSDESMGGSADGYELTSLLLTDSDVLETYEEGNPTVPNPNAINVGEAAEWDFALQNNDATPGAQYCFRMVNADGTELDTYTQFPTLVTNASPLIEDMFAPFDNEKLASTSPWFEFIGYDENGDEVDYQIQIDNDYAFSSTVIDTDSETNLDDFLNIATPSDKTPFNNYARMRYTIPSSLSNGVTYWWRVRSKDASGSAAYGDWSTPQSFTVDTSLTVSTWYQTTEEQFETNTHDGTEATASDLVAFASGSTVATTTSTAIDFSDATIGNVWGELSFNETGSANDILYHIEYENDGDWFLIPDSALSGNAAGYDSSPVDLSGLDVTLYDVIRIRANFRTGAPTLLDWTLAWAESIEVPTLSAPFDNEKFATTSPTFGFSSSDPENDDIEYEVSWSTDYNFATGSTTRNSSTSPTGFVNLVNGGDTNPFDSGDTISYKIQPGDALSASTTYWWRARAKDPSGSDNFSTWSEPWSFTTATSGEPVQVSTWFQTLGLQFDKGTLSGVDAATNSVGIGGGIVVESGWTSNTAIPGSSLTLTKPSGVVSGDLLLILVGSDDNSATAQWNDTTLKPSGFTLINESGNDTVSDAHAAAFYRVANGSEGTTINVPAQSSDDFWGFYIRVTGASTTDPINVIGADYNGGSAASHAVTGITTTEDQSLAFYLLSGDGGDVYPFTVSGTGWTESDEIQAGGGTANASGVWGTQLVASAGGTGAATVGLSVADSATGFQFAVNPAVLSSGSIKSDTIDFDDGSGPGWGELSWRDSEPGGSEVRYQIEFLNGLGVWGLIPDSALPGNSTGFTTSPIDLEALNTTTYNQIRIVGNLNCSGANCPTLDDWTVTWIAGFTVSGTALEYDGVSSTTAGTVAVAVNGVLQSGATGAILGDGTWEIENIPLFSGDVITTFISGANDVDEAVGVTVFDGTPDVTGMRLQKRHLTIGSNDFVTATNTQIGMYDYTNDEDLFFDVNAGNDLTMCADTGCTDASIVVLTRNTYAPGTGADVTTHDLRNYGTFTAGSNSIRVSGSWDNNATTTMTGSTVIFTATSSTESIDETGSVTSGFNNVTFGETSGTATWNTLSTLDVDGNLGVSFGTLARGTTSIFVAGNLTIGASGYWTGMGTTTFDGINPSTWTDNNAVKQNVGRVLVDGTTKTLVLGSNVTMQSMTIGANDAFDASITGFSASVYEDWINNNTFTARTGTVSFIATTTNRIITTGSSAFYNLTFSGVGGSWSFTAPTLTVSNHLTIATGTVTLPTATTTVAGSFLNTGGVFAHNNGTVVMSSTAGGRSITQSGGTFLNAFYNLVFTGSGSWAFTESNATTSNTFRIQAGTVTLPSGTLTVSGDFTTTGTGAFTHNSGEVIFVVQNSKTVSTNGSSFNNVRTRGGIATSWYNDSWTRRIPITIQASQIDAGLTNFPVYVNLDDLSSAFFSTVKTDGSDIRVTESDGVTEVPIELVSIDTSGTDGELYFRATSVSSTTDTTFYIYYGNSGASAYASTSPYGARSVWSNGYTLVSHMNDLTTSVVQNSVRTITGVKTDTAGSPVSNNPLEVSTGRVKKAQSFDTTPIQYTGSFLNGQTQYNVSMWFNPDTLAGAAPQETNTYGYSLYGVSTAGVYDWTSVGGTPAPDEVCVRAFTTVTTCNVTTGADLVAGNWYHVSINAVRNSTVTTRVNGVARGSFTAGNSDPTANFTISGLRPNRVPPISFDGRIDEVRVSTTTRADAWRDAEYRNMATSTSFYTAGGEESSRSRRFSDTNTTILGNYISELGGDAVFPTGVLSIGGSFDNNAIFDANGGTVRFNSSGGSETIAAGTSAFSTLDFNSASGDFTVTESATGTVAVSLTNVSQFTLNSGLTLTASGTFTHAANGSNTTWTGSTLRLTGGDSALNSKSHAGDVYGTLLVVGDTDISMWNSSANTYSTLDTASIYSQDHSAVDGDLYIFGDYTRTSGTEHWSYATDFDGTALGGSSRQVDVRLASGTSATLSGSTFSMIGSSTATTTVANQGSGTYVVIASSTATTFNNYEFSNLGTAGVTFRGAGTISSLNDGFVKPGISAGTGFTVASSSINANPGFQIYRVNFSTTTAISATNVTQTDGTPTSYWWFRDSTGNIDGEAFDNDTGDPGSVRWDDSSLVITVSGVVYSDDGVTRMGNPVCDDVTANIRIVVQGGSSYTGTCASANGSFSIPGVVVVGDPVVTVYLNTNGGAKGTVVTRTPISDITDLDIYQNRVITRHEDTEPMTILKMSAYDNDNDSDISFVAATGTLTVLANTELHIASSSTFAPDGNITINGNASSTAFDGSLHIDNNAIFTGSASSTYTIGGSFTMDDGATFASASTTVIMNATTTGKTITTTGTQEITFNTIEFNGLGGGWNINGDIRALQDIDVTLGTVTGTADITVVNGSLSGNGVLSMGSGTTTIYQTNTLGGTTAWTLANLVLGNGSIIGTTTPGSNATTTILGKLTINTAHYLDAGSSLWNLSGTGNVFVESGTFLEDTSTVRYSGAGATNVISTTYYNLDLKAQGSSPTYTGTGLGIIVSNNLTVGGPNATTFTLDTSDPAFDVNGNITIDSTGTLIGSASANFTVAGSWDNNGTYTGSSGTVTFDGAGTPSIAAGNSPFANLTINGSGAFTVSEPATTTGAFSLTNAGSFTLASGQSLAVGGLFTNGQGGGVTTWTSSVLHFYGSGSYSINASTTSDTYEKLSVGSGTQIRMWNSTAGTYDTHANGSLYSQDHGGVNGDLYIYGAYSKTSGTDYWSYTTDFDGTNISGTPRNVDVYIRGGGSVLYTGGGLSVLGLDSASTTIQNQGSGTYSFRIGGSASTTWSYYDMQDMDASGLTLSGTPNVVTLAYGDITVSQNSGTAMTVGGTVITQNPAKTFTNNYFATSTGITPAYNVTATGTTASSWRFTNHAGSIDGEDFDVDPDGNPGYIVWDNSSSSITVSGTVYSDEGTTPMGVSVCDGSTQSIHLRVGGLTSYTGSCNGSGLYSIPGVLYSPNDSLVVYIDGETEKAATVTEDPVSNITGLDLYENRVIVRHESSDPLSIVDMSLWDSSDDADIPFTAVDGTPDTLTLPANRKLIVWTGKEFEPNGNITVTGGGGGSAYDGTLELYTNAVFDATGSETHSIGGSLISGTGASIDDETSTFVFTTSGAGRTVDTNSSSLYDATFNGSGSWTVTNTTFDIGNDFTVAQGTVTLPSATTTVTGSLSVTGGSFTSSGGTMVFNSGSAETIRPRSSSFGTLVVNGVGSFSLQGGYATTTGDVRIVDGSFTSATGTLTIGGNFINSDVFVHGSGELRFTSAGAVVVTASTSDLYSTTFAGGGAYTFTNTNVALLGSLTIQSGAVTLATGTMSIGGSLLNTGGSFNNASGSILFNSSDTGEIINPGNSLFHNVTLASGGGGWTISANATTTGNFSLTSASSFTQSSSTRLYVGGVFTNLVGGAPTTWTGSTLVINSGSSYTINSKSAGGDTYNNIRVGSSTELRAWDSTGTITITDSESSFYSQDHAGVSGVLYIYGDYERTAGADYWSYATDFDGTALGGSSRQVFVYIAANATTTLQGGSLNIVGASGFDTTISNQGSGTYAIDILGGTLNALYYSFANMNVDGLKLSGLTTVSSLTEGNFTLAVNGGSLITLSSTTLNYNAGLFVTGVAFATTTAITGANVELSGSTPSAWTFVSHTGNFDGEAFDIDGGDACGSIRWDDSNCILIEQSAYRFRNDDGGEGVPNSEWFDFDWSKRKRVTVTNSDPVTYHDVAVKVIVPYDSDMQADFDDLRFTEEDGLTAVEHFTESYTASTQAVVWVKVPTLATSTTATVYMYYGEGTVSDGSATSTFDFMDNFEDGNISEYTGDTGDFSVVGSSAYERTYRLEAFDQTNSKTDQNMRNLGVTVAQGQTLRWLQYIDTVSGAADESCTHFGVQTGATSYAVCLELFGVDRLSISENATHRDTSGTVLASTTVTYSTGWYEVEVDWDTDDSIYVRLSKNGSVVATTSATDSSYTSGGVGFTLWGYHGGWDIYSARPLMATAATTSLGGEQVPGGATWTSARNTPASGIDIGETARVRFLVENSGTPVSAQNYEIEFAPKGAAPSCESVDYNDYVEVPNVASCGTSDICMVSSSNITDLESTTDLLGGSGVFTPGQVVEDSSNNTGSLDVDSGEFTELEYVIAPTINVSDSNYCFRVTNEGAELDAYTKVAELSLVFTPVVTSLSLNGGNDITLSPGATTTIYATGTVSDLNGYGDLNLATTTMFRSSVLSSCTSDPNNCYIASPTQCVFENCSGSSCDVTCSADFYYHADPTDVGTYAGQTWRAELSVSDQSGAIATGTAPSIDLLTLRAITVDSTINYGALEVNNDTGSYNATTTVENIGNDALDIAIAGTDLTDGNSSLIPVNEQIFATSTFTYTTCTFCSQLSASSTNYELDLTKPTSTTPSVSDQLFWGIAIPFGVAGNPHQGTNTFYAIGD